MDFSFISETYSLFKLSLVAAMVVTIKATTRRLL